MKFTSDRKLAETPLIDRRIKEGFSPPCKMCTACIFFQTIDNQWQISKKRTSQPPASASPSSESSELHGRKEGRKGYLVGRLRRCGRIVWFPPQSPSDSRRGRREGEVSLTPTKKLPSQKQAREEGGREECSNPEKEGGHRCKEERCGGRVLSPSPDLRL